jgi:hypothetical protein
VDRQEPRLQLRRGGVEAEVAVPLEPGSTVGDDPDAVYRLALETVSAAFATGDPLRHGRDEAVAQAMTLEAIEESARTSRPVVVCGAPALLR